MNKDNAKLYLPLVQALADGKTLEFRYNEREPWMELPTHDISFAYEAKCYRIKPEPPKVYCVLRNGISVVAHYNTLHQAQVHAGKWNAQAVCTEYTVKTFIMVEENNDGNC